mgnify:FL=1
MRKVLMLVALLVFPSGHLAAQDRLKAGETLGAEVKRAVSCDEVWRALARAEAFLAPQDTAAIRAAVVAARPECQKGETR